MKFHVAFPDDSLNLHPECESDPSNVDSKSNVLSLSNCISDQDTILFFCCVISEDCDMFPNFLKSAIRALKFFRDAISKYHCDVSLMYGSKTHTLGDQIARGVCVHRLSQNSNFSEEEIIDFAMESGYQTHFSVKCILQGRDRRFRVLEKDSKTKDILSDRWYRLTDSFTEHKGPLTGYCQSRLFSSSDLCPVYHNYQSTREILKKVNTVQLVPSSGGSPLLDCFSAVHDNLQEMC